MILYRIDSNFNLLYFFTYLVIIYTLILVNFVVEKNQSAVKIKRNI